FGRGVAGLHDHRRQVGADRDGGEVEGAEPRADFLEALVVGRVAREVETLRPAGDRPTAPETPVAVERGAPGEVLRGSTREGEPAHVPAVPPVELLDVGDAALREPRLEAERHEEARP